MRVRRDGGKSPKSLPMEWRDFMISAKIEFKEPAIFLEPISRKHAKTDAMQLARSCLLDLFAQELRRSALTGA
jgi:hypothetical protein